MKLGSRRVYSGRVVDVDIDTVRFPDGSVGELEIIRHSGASAVVPVLSDGASADPEVLLLHQFRYAAGGPVWEIPAGRLDRGETPEDCALRELTEETGLTAGRLTRLTAIHTTPGFTDELIHIFVADALVAGQHRREPDEFMDTRAMPLSRALEMIRAGEISDAKSMAALLFFSRFGLGV